MCCDDHSFQWNHFESINFKCYQFYIYHICFYLFIFNLLLWLLFSFSLLFTIDFAILHLYLCSNTIFLYYYPVLIAPFLFLSLCSRDVSYVVIIYHLSVLYVFNIFLCFILINCFIIIVKSCNSFNCMLISSFEVQLLNDFFIFLLVLIVVFVIVLVIVDCVLFCWYLSSVNYVWFIINWLV